MTQTFPKLRICLYMSILLSFSVPAIHLLGQTRGAAGVDMPLQMNHSPLFGLDTYLNNQPLQNQRNVVICSAFNGWLYAAYCCFNDTISQDMIYILRSKDNGASWAILLYGPYGAWNVLWDKLEILACGTDTNNLKIFLGQSLYSTIDGSRQFQICRYNRNLEFENEILHENSFQGVDFAMATDGLYPATGANPFSLGIVYSKLKAGKDSILFCSSSDGGMSFDKRYRIASTTQVCHKVALAYGRSLSHPEGRYFAAWEEKVSGDSPGGHIWTAHSEPGFNSPFSTPLQIDSLVPGAENNTASPSIACQISAADNDSVDMTEVILFEKFRPETNQYSIAGIYNKKATTTDVFHPFTIDATLNNQLQPAVCFNPYDSSFIATYWDSTLQKLPYRTHEFNMTDPDAWGGLSAGYNDDDNLIAPHPRVTLDYFTHTGANIWIGNPGGGNGAVLFDAPFVYYAGKKDDLASDRMSIAIHPNPASDAVTVGFKLREKEEVEIRLYNALGLQVGGVTNREFQSGRHSMVFDVSDFPSGYYFVTLSTKMFVVSGRVIIKQ